MSKLKWAGLLHLGIQGDVIQETQRWDSSIAQGKNRIKRHEGKMSIGHGMKDGIPRDESIGERTKPRQGDFKQPR